jgi:hypothetical protein
MSFSTSYLTLFSCTGTSLLMLYTASGNSTVFHSNFVSNTIPDQNKCAVICADAGRFMDVVDCIFQGNNSPNRIFTSVTAVAASPRHTVTNCVFSNQQWISGNFAQGDGNTVNSTAPHKLH